MVSPAASAAIHADAPLLHHHLTHAAHRTSAHASLHVSPPPAATKDAHAPRRRLASHRSIALHVSASAGLLCRDTGSHPLGLRTAAPRFVGPHAAYATHAAATTRRHGGHTSMSPTTTPHRQAASMKLAADLRRRTRAARCPPRFHIAVSTHAATIAPSLPIDAAWSDSATASLSARRHSILAGLPLSSPF